jgi:lipoprotein-releasing system permease protein
MNSSALLPHQAGLTIGFVVIGVLLMLLRGRVELARGKRGRAAWLFGGTIFGPLFAGAAFWSRTVTHGTKVSLGRHEDLFAIAVLGGLTLVVVAIIGARAYVTRNLGKISAWYWVAFRFFISPVVAVAVFFGGKKYGGTKGVVDHIDTVASGLALVFAVVFVVGVLSALLPWLLDRLEGRTFVAFVAARHVRSQKSGFLTVISVLSICGVAISSCALSSVVSVMGGFSHDLKRKILGNNAHIVIDTTTQAPWSDYDVVLEHVRAVKGVTAATAVVNGEVMVSSPSNLAGVIVRGIDPNTIGSVIDLPSNIEVGKLAYLGDPEALRHLPADEVIGLGPGGEQYMKGPDLPSFNDDLDPAVRAIIDTGPPLRPGIIIGRELAKTLHVYVGDEVTLVSPLGDLGPMGVMPRTKKFRVAAIFFSGMYEYDASHVYTTMEIAQDYFTQQGKISAIDVKVEDAENAEVLTPIVTAAVGRADLRVRDWREINKNLFSALKLERYATFIILCIAIMVASFCIVSTLLLMVTEKSKEIAILKALGAPDGSILRTFMLEGMIIGGIGTVYGVMTGLVLCTGLAWFGLRLDPDVYYIDRLPITVSGLDFLSVTASALIICTLATIFPSYAASQLRPVDGLRYE